MSFEVWRRTKQPCYMRRFLLLKAPARPIWKFDLMESGTVAVRSTWWASAPEHSVRSVHVHRRHIRNLRVCSQTGKRSDLKCLHCGWLQVNFSVNTCLCRKSTQRWWIPNRNAVFKNLREIWNSFYSFFFFFKEEGFLHAWLPFAAQWRMLLPGNRHNNDTGALSLALSLIQCSWALLPLLNNVKWHLF